MSTHLQNVLMQQSYGPKATMPTQRDTGELLLALNEFNKYELFTGTGTGVQPLFSDGTGTSNVSFTVNQDSADTLNGKFVYFDNESGTWKPAYASATPSAGDHFTAQGFAVSMNSTGIQVTTSGKLIVPFKLTDYTGASVVAGSYYYLCQTEANAGMIQQNAPSSGIMQIVCQVIAVDDNSTTLLLLNDLSQVANDIIITDGDGSKYLGDDGQYHDMMVAGLAGRTSNCLDTYEILDINFENVAAGRSAATAYTFPTLTANGAWDDTTAAAAITGMGYNNEGAQAPYSPTTLFNVTAGTNQVFTATGSVNSGITYKFLQSTFLTTITIINHTDTAQADNNIHTFTIKYADSVEGPYNSTNYTITAPTNTAGAQYTVEIPLELSKQWGAHKFWLFGQLTSFSGSTETFATNKITPSGYYYTDSETPSYGYIANGDITVQDGIASGWGESNYIISKYLVENYTQWSFRVRKTFTQVTNEDPIWQSPNKTNYLAIENGALKLVLNGLTYRGNLVYSENTPYDFKINYNINSGYVISVSSNNSDTPSWTNEIILYDEVNYLDSTTWMLGIASQADQFTVGTGTIDLNYTGMDYVNNERSFDTYPLSDLTAKDISIITVTFKGTGLVAQGRAGSTTTLNAQAVEVDTTENTIIMANDATDLVWDTSKGLTTTTYSEVDYLRTVEDQETNTTVYARDTNYCYGYTVVYPNFLQTNVTFETDAETVKPNCILVGDIQCENGVLSGFSNYNYAKIRQTFNPGSQPWSNTFCYTTPAAWTDSRIWSAGAITDYTNNYVNTNAGCIGMDTSGMLRLWISSSAGIYDIANGVTATTALALNTKYYIRTSFTGTAYTVEASTELNGTYTTYITVESELPTIPFIPYIGVDNAVFSAGTIDLKESSWSLNGETWWEGTIANPDQNNIKLDLSGANATFHPNTFLNRNGFNFQLKLDLEGNLKLDRTLDARNYGSAQAFPAYYQVQGVDWSTFQGDSGYTQGVKISAPLGSTNTGTANGSIYQLTVNDANYADASYGSQDACAPVFHYFAFQNPIKFANVLFRNHSNANHVPVQLSIHVSNDMNTWYNVLPSTTAGYTANGMWGNLPIDAYANYTNRTINALWDQIVTMPDSNQYYKYVRVGCFQGATNPYRPVLSGCWIGPNYFNAFTDVGMAQTAKELIFEKTNFINTDTSGINAAVVRKKTGTAYQVRFLDKIGYVETPPEEGITDITGKTLAPNDEPIYEDERLQTELEAQRLAYQTQCKRYLRNDCDYARPVANNIGQYQEAQQTYAGCANTGTVASSYNLLQSNTTTYDFANALLESSFIVSFLNKARVGYFYIQNHTTAAYSTQQIKVYGAVDAGAFDGTTSDSTTTLNETAAVWEEIPIINIVNAYNNGDFEHYAPTQKPNTTVLIGNNANDLVGTAGTGNYGAFNVYIAPTKAYRQYRITVQRTTNNRVIQMAIMPKDVWFDPWATPTDSSGNNKPLLVDTPYYPSSSATVLPDKATLLNGIYTSPYSATTVWQLYQNGNNANWTPENSRRYVYLQQAFPYAVNMNNTLIQHGTDLNYACNLFEYYGTNLTELATEALSNTNSLSSWSRLTSLIDKCDIPTAIPTTQTINSVLLGAKEYGYSYFTAIFRRSINNQIYMDGFKPRSLTLQSYTANSTDYDNASRYVEEWKWTNVEGEAGTVRNGACYNHPLLQTGDYTSLTPAYVVTKRGDETKYYTETQGEADSYLPDNTEVYRTTSLVGNVTTPYENRWMYKFTDTEQGEWYCNTAPTGTAGTIGSYMYRNIVPKYNTEVYTGIPLDATANTGSANGYTYFASSEYSEAYYAWNAFSLTSTTMWVGAVDSYDMTTGLPTADAQYVGFISPTPLTIQGYTIGGRTTNPSNPSKWKFQGSNDGDAWEDIDTRDTTLAEDADVPLNPDAGTTYYFNNEKSYTHFRWLIEQLTPGASGDSYGLLKCKGLFVLEENPVPVYSIFVLSYTDHESVQHTAYTNVTGSSGQYIANNGTIYSDINLQTPITNVWAYMVSDGEHTYYTQLAGDSGSYVPETTMIYEDADFTVEFGEALLDTWTYTGAINQKYSYTGQQLNNFTWNGEEPYNKYFYTGEIANQYKYTGKIEGWAYTGVTKDIYDIVPNIELNLNRDDARKIQKATLLGNAYPVTNQSNPSGTSYYSFTSGDVAGTIVPSGTPLYASITDTESVATADGTNAYIFSSAPVEQRYTYEYLYVRNTDLPTGQNLVGDEQAYQDANLITPAPEVTNLTEYTYTDTYEPSKMTSLYHRITEVTPIEDYNFGLQFDGSKYTFTCYADGSTSDIQEYQNGDLVKSSYQGPDQNVQNSAVIMMTQQDLLKLNLSRSTYSWWTWNNLSESTTTRTTLSLFRLGKIEGSANAIEQIDPLYPWRVGEGGTSETSTIGDPIFTLSNTLKSNEIWLEGQELLIAKYRKLYQVYGTTYGEASDNLHFKVPDFRNRSIWGVSSTDTLGYISGGAPDITGSILFDGTNNGYQASGCFWLETPWYGWGQGHGSTTVNPRFNFSASRSSSVYGAYSGIRPDSLAVRVKTKAK